MNDINESLEQCKHGHNILKCRDDFEPVEFELYAPETQENGGNKDQTQFKLVSGSKCSWIKDDEPFGTEKLRPRIEPWLTALSQSEHFSVLIGSGLSQAVHILANEKPMQGMGSVVFSVLDDKIKSAAERTAKEASRDIANIEDQFRVANEILRGLEHLCPELTKKNAENYNTKQNLKISILDNLSRFANAVLDGEKNIVSSSINQQEKAFNYLMSFLLSFASRSGTRDRLQIFTTNYDRIIEAGAEIAGLHLIDRFVGNLAPIFRSSRMNIDMHYNPPGMRGEPRYLEGVARYTKLHGSLDWVYANREVRRIGLPFGADSIEPYFNAPGFGNANACDLMIYPNSAKDRETAVYPFVELFRDFAAAICQPNSTIVTYGYSFGDEHINRIIEDMLTIPSTHLVIISKSDTLGRIMKLYNKIGRSAQVTLMIGDHLAELTSLVDNYLPKPAIDRTTFKMTELLNSRYVKSDHSDDAKKKGQENELKPD